MPFREIVQEHASVAQRRLAAGLCLTILLVLGLLAPYGAHALPPLAHISGIYGAATTMISLATFWLLISAPIQQRAHSIIAAAYLYAALMGALHVLTFPGAVLQGRPLMGSADAVSALFIAWRAGFAGFVLWAALSDHGGAHGLRQVTYWPAGAAAVAALAAAVAAQLTDAAATRDDAGLQAFSAFSVFGAYAAAALAALAIGVIWVRGLHRRSLYVWLVVVLVAEAAGVCLSTYSGARYTLAWYAVRVEGVLASTVVLVLLAQHFRSMQRQLAAAVQGLLGRTEALQAAVHQRERAERDLAQAEKLRLVGQLGAGLAHDLNNILQVMTVRLSILERRAGLAGAADIGAIRRSVAKAEALTRQLSLLSVRRAIVAHPISPGKELERIADNIGQLLEARHVLELQSAGPLGDIRVDSLELEIALTNLVTNARDAMPSGGRIGMQVREEVDAALGRVCVIEVSDQGAGMSAAVLERIFEPFFTTKAPGKGTGLGLPQVAAFVQASGGRVSVTSTPGQGTQVALRLPAAAPVSDVPSSYAPCAQVPEPAQVSSPRSILLVDDNQEVREASQQLLESSGFVVTAVSSGEEALERLHSGDSPDVMVSDIVMPLGMHGVELVREVRRRFPAITSVLVTGRGEEADAAASEGFCVVSKPYDLATLLGALQALHR